MCILLEQGFLMSGQKVVDMDVPENGISEVLRLFIKSRSGHEDEVGFSEVVCGLSFSPDSIQRCRYVK